MALDMTQLRTALEYSWDDKTSYMGVFSDENISLGQCYSTSRVVQFFFPKTEIVEGEVWNGQESHKHFWNFLKSNESEYHIDLTWQQFPKGSIVKGWKIRERETLGDSKETIERIELLKQRVKGYLANHECSNINL